MTLRNLAFILVPVLLFTACHPKTSADLLVYNAKIYTIDSTFTIAEAMVVKEGKIAATGKLKDIQTQYDCKEKLDAGGKAVYPGFIDAHAHFVEYARSLQELNLVGTTSWEDILQRCADFGKGLDSTQWLIGRGWDQNKWPVKEFPSNEQLTKMFPHRPVYLARIDGHAGVANDAALQIAGIRSGQTISGGNFEMKNGKLTGLLLDNAMGFVESKIPAPGKAAMKKMAAQAQQHCFAAGLTTVEDCGLDGDAVEMIRQLQEEGALQLRLFIMLSDAPKNYAYAFSHGKIKTPLLNVSAFKAYGDGALGSRGACLLQDYSDKPGWKGFLRSSAAHFDSIAALVYAKGWQLCTHAIGDSANRVLLNIYAKYLKGSNDRRWRIEHAQIVNAADIALFGKYNIIPSVQPTHATSDMYWAGQRLGPQRIKDGYVYKSLLQQNGWIPLGTDFPVEDISPMKTFYAAVIRKDAKGFPAQGFQASEALTRKEALYGMTAWAARANFEEYEKGSLEKGHWADFVILDQDIMQVPEDRLLATKVVYTFSGGKKVFSQSIN